MIEANWEGGSPDSIDIANFYWSIASRQHPAIKAADEACQAAYCDTGYFCCGSCNCETNLCPDGYANRGPGREHNCLYDSITDVPGCEAWDNRPWWDWNYDICKDAVAQKTIKTIDRIQKNCEETTGPKAMARLTGNAALIYSNERASDILYNNTLIDVESILVGMINTNLQAGAIAGAIAGASQVFHYVMTQYLFKANDFLASFEPYNPPPIGGGGLP
jgi:hypothetical protein